MRRPARAATTIAYRFVAGAWLASAHPPASAGEVAPSSNADGDRYSAAYVSEEVPPFIELFVTTAVSVTMRNTGTETWFEADGDVFLATQEPQDNHFWCIQDNPHGMYSGNRVQLPHDVAPGETVTFEFLVKPLSCGFAATAPFRFRMLSQVYGTFGEETPDPAAYVSTAATFVSQQTPDIAPAGARLRVSVSFRNTTNSTWAPTDGYSLGSAGPTGNTIWGSASVALTESVAPGALATFTFFITIPDAPDTYNFQWQMNSSGSVPFGQVSPATPIQVVAAGPPNYGGLWWAKPAGSESGWGINLAHQGDVIFATWFTYDATGSALWLSLTAPKTSTGTYSGTLVQTTGPAFDVVPFRPDRVRVHNVGTATLTFPTTDDPFDVQDGTFEYTLNGVTQTKSITREVFGKLPPRAPSAS